MSKKGPNTFEKTVFLDIGNTSVKAAYKAGNSWKMLNKIRWTPIEFIDFIKSGDHNFENVIASSVRRDHFKTIRNALPDLDMLKVGSSGILSEKLDYNTPETLGIDRYLGCLGAYTLDPNPVIVIDAGTACTIDFMDAEGVYRGGLIMPGLHSIVNIFKESAPELPEIEISIPEIWPGKSTQESLQWGQIGFFVEGLEGLLRKFFSEFGQIPVYITGGDASVIAALISIDVQIDEFLVFKGIETLVI